jgi:hypothetical protein
MTSKTKERNETLVLKAFDALFNKREQTCCAGHRDSRLAT